MLLAWRTVPDVAPEPFARRGAPAFAPPQATPLPDGGVRIALWVQEPSGMLPQSVFSHVAFTFGPSGATSDEERLGGFETPLR